MNDETTKAPEPETPVATTEAAPPAFELPQAGILDKIVRAIDRAISADPTRTEWALTTFMILESAGGHRLIIGKDGLATLKDLQNQHDTVIKFINNHNPDASRKAYEESQKTLAAAIHAGTAHDMTGKSRADFEQDYLHQQNAAKLDLTRIYKQALPICSVVSDRFVALASKKTDDMENADRDRHDYYGVTYDGPSNLIKAFRRAIKIAQSRTVEAGYGNYSPRQMCPYLPL
jgi:hypothetical protein